MKPSRLFFCTQSRFGSKEANCIQVEAMGNAFAEWCGEVVMVFRGGELGQEPHRSGNLTRFALPAGKGRLGIWLFAVRAYFLFRKLGKKREFGLVFSRSILFAALAAAGRSNLAFELHSGLGRLTDRLLLRWLVARGAYLVCISEPIAREIRAAFPDYRRIGVFQDGHGFPIQPFRMESDRGEGGKMKIGYFGSLTAQKGADILREMIEKSERAEYHVFSKEEGRLAPMRALAEYRYLPHHECCAMMRSMDALLLMVVPQGKGDRISSYTSPLKLFEYLAAGRPVLASDVPALREIVDGETVLYCGNSAEGFLSGLERLRSDPELGTRMASRGQAFARMHTWSERASKILNACEVKNGNNDTFPVRRAVEPSEAPYQETV